jgi:hypothetical protein
MKLSDCLLYSVILAVGVIIYNDNHQLPLPVKVNSFSYETVSDMPEQSDTNKIDFEIKNTDGIFKIDPLHEYKMTAMVMSRENYDWNWDGRLVPVDLALAWGDLTKPELIDKVKYWQSGRWYYYEYNRDFPREKSYIISHSANNHMLPANDKIREALQKLNKHQIVHFEGYLISIDGKVGGRKVTWSSSQTREDSGDHSCELFYVNKLVVGNKIYI